MATISAVHWLRQKLARPNDTTTPFDSADFSPALQTRLLILQPTPFCNIDCDYCYLPDRASKARMDIDVVRKAVQRLLQDGLAGRELTVIWHAGEPLAMPRDFYDDAVAVVHDVLGSHCAVTHCIQTNATLIDDAWCELFKRHDFRIGVSVDGPADLHDAHRRTRGGAGTHDRVMRGMSRLRTHGIPFHAIAVVTTSTFKQADAFYEFFVEQGVTELSCNFDEAEGEHADSSLAGHEAEHATFILRLLDRASADRGRLRLRQFGMALQLIARPLPTYRWLGRNWPDNEQTQPFAIISVAHNGDFSTFSPELLGQHAPEYDNFILGNVAACSYLASAQNAGFERLWAAVARGVSACEKDCAHFSFCGGGAPANKFYENGDLATGETLYCRTMLKRPFDVMLERLEREATWEPHDETDQGMQAQRVHQLRNG